MVKMIAFHPLDSPIWNALTSHHDGIAEGGALARRYPEDIAPFADMIDTSDASFAELASLIPPTGQVAMFTVMPIVPPGWLNVTLATTMEQMVRTSTQPVSRAAEAVPLANTEIPAMLALVQLTNPGPFSARTKQLGRFLGVRSGSTLAAMAGERMRLEGFTEVSAVCTDPAFRGKGYARALVDSVASAIIDRGEVPFLHAFSANIGAIELYRRAGFTIRRRLHLTVLGHATQAVGLA